MLDADAGPGFEVFAVGVEVCERVELELLDGVFVGGDVVAAEIKEMHHAEVHAADLVGIVIDEADYALGVGATDAEFFCDLALDSVEVEGLAKAVVGLIHRIDVATDADAALCNEAFFARGTATGVTEVTPVVMKDGVRDDLLVGGVLLSTRALHEKIGTWAQDGLEVTVCVRLKALEGAELIKQRAWDDEDVFHEGAVRWVRGERKEIGGVSGLGKPGRLCFLCG